MMLGIVAQACNPSYSGGGDWEDCGQNVDKTASQPIKARCGDAH
jgi:hypothetical protein